MIGVTIDAIRVGDGAEIARVATEHDIAGFVDAVGDHNPIHSDPGYAAGTMFGARIAPGIWTAGLISAAIGTRLPGPGTIYLSQDLKFLRPVMLGDAIRARVEVLEANREKNRVRLRTVCVNQRDEAVLSGEALVMPPRTPVVYEPAVHEPVLYDQESDPAGLFTVWALQPWAWAAQGVATAGMLALSALPIPDGAARRS